jgi:hypothetical protein
VACIRGPNLIGERTNQIPDEERFSGEESGWETANLSRSGRIAQRESARFTRERSLVQSQVRPSKKSLQVGVFVLSAGRAAERIRGAASIVRA